MVLPLATYSKFAVLCDENTRRECLPLIQALADAAEIIELAPGERSKSFDGLQQVLHQMACFGLDRKSLLINLGGGVISDIGGFAASIFKRGIATINIPTSLMGMADAAIGGKTGINSSGGKNQIGTFHMPEAVLVDSQFLLTLPNREWLSGYGEILKYGLIVSQEMFSAVVQAKDPHHFVTQKLIQNCAEIKIKIVESDPYDLGHRNILNLGHTIGHSIESFFHQSGIDISHGHAVALGLCIELRIAAMVADFPITMIEQLEPAVMKLFGKEKYPNFEFNSLLPFLKADKKNESGDVRMPIMKAPGEVWQLSAPIPLGIIENSFDQFLTSWAGD